MDTTYFRRRFGTMVFRDHNAKRNLYWQYVKNETVQLYKEGIYKLQTQGWKVIAVVCDGRRGLFTAFKGIPTQMCHFHQKAIIRRYLTQNSRTQASHEPKELSYRLKDIDKESWILTLDH